jgi:diguanylate cyclase (GGDEF)-like protein
MSVGPRSKIAILRPVDDLEPRAALQPHVGEDIAVDARLEGLVRLATQLYHVPVAFISLADGDAEWLAAGIGMDFTEEMRSHLMRLHVLLESSGTMVVEDAGGEPRFQENPLVAGGGGIGFFAAAPILSSENMRLGTLCMLDHRPRVLNPAERESLADLASSAAAVVELKRYLLGAEQAATHDALTGLGNRALFEQHLQQITPSSPGGVHFALLILDLDHFKAVNDQYGHDGGDVLLRAAARRLRACIRGKDIAFRLGGDEFAVIVRGPFPAHAPRLLARRILASFEAPMEIGCREVSIHCSIGIAVAPGDGQDGAAISRAAEMALFRAKAVGRGSIMAAADLVPSARPAQQNTLELDLKNSVLTGAFELHWQPYFATDSGQIIGHEALLRWNRPGHGYISPQIFIPLAEQSDLIADLDAWVLERACTAAAAWPQPHHVSVNIAPHWFCRGDLTALVTQVLARTGLDPRRLVLEMTERTLIDYPEMVRTRIAGLKKIGVSVALDDFGIGYAALASLKDFEFSKLKLDRSFMSDIGRDARADHIVRAIMAMANGLKLQVCAEGVETREQLAFLQAEGCHLVQGFLLAAPTPEILTERPRSSAVRKQFLFQKKPPEFLGSAGVVV